MRSRQVAAPPSYNTTNLEFKILWEAALYGGPIKMFVALMCRWHSLALTRPSVPIFFKKMFYFKVGFLVLTCLEIKWWLQKKMKVNQASSKFFNNCVRKEIEFSLICPLVNGYFVTGTRAPVACWKSSYAHWNKTAEDPAFNEGWNSINLVPRCINCHHACNTRVGCLSYARDWNFLGLELASLCLRPTGLVQLLPL